MLFISFYKIQSKKKKQTIIVIFQKKYNLNELKSTIRLTIIIKSLFRCAAPAEIVVPVGSELKRKIKKN